MFRLVPGPGLLCQVWGAIRLFGQFARDMFAWLVSEMRSRARIHDARR